MDKKREVISMPRGDGTGPLGAGPMTGRGAGYCTGYAAPGYVNSGYGCFRPGGGRGRGIRRALASAANRSRKT